MPQSGNRVTLNPGVADQQGLPAPNVHFVFTTGAAANPTLTIVALAIRQAEHIGERVRTGTL